MRGHFVGPLLIKVLSKVLVKSKKNIINYFIILRRLISMSYNHSFVLEGLKSFYYSMKKIDVEIGTFEHKYNGIISDVIIDTRSREEWEIVFIKRVLGDTLKFPVKKGYLISIEGNDAYYKFRKYFGISGKKGEFSIKDFMINLNNQIPAEYIISDIQRKTVLRYDKLDTDSDGIYPIGITNWEVVHARNSSLPKERYHRSSRNLIKTKQLYPNIYKATKDMDITIIYGTEPNEKTEKYKKGKI